MSDCMEQIIDALNPEMIIDVCNGLDKKQIEHFEAALKMALFRMENHAEASTDLIRDALDELNIIELAGVVTPEVGTLLLQAVRAMSHDDYAGIVQAHFERETALINNYLNEEDVTH